MANSGQFRRNIRKEVSIVDTLVETNYKNKQTTVGEYVKRSWEEGAP